MKKQSEIDIQRDICHYLESRNFLFWRFSPETFNAKLGIHIKHRFIPNGLPDIMLLHPGDTKRFPALAHDHIISWSNEGDTVLDPFMGSGTTGKMAKQLGRNFIGIELDKDYYEIAKKRIEETTIKNLLNVTN